MAKPQVSGVIDYVRRLAADGGPRPVSDGELLRRYVRERDAGAFEALVRGHGPLVWGVCRRALGRVHDAEDAFQATFLALARKAGSIRSSRSLASWLHGVAYRTALHARRSAARRREHEGHAPVRTEKGPAWQAAWQEVQALLDEEIGRLPEALQAPFLLCHLEGLSRAEAAARLGLTEAAVWGRLARARARLQQRLTRRGVSLSAVLATAALGEGLAVAAPAPLVAATARAALTAGASVTAARATLLTLAVLALTVGAVAWGAWAQQAPQGPSGGPGERPRPGGAPEARRDRDGEPLPEGAVARLGTLRLRHGGFIHFARFTPDGKTLVSQGSDGVRTWDVATGRQRHFFPNDPPSAPATRASLSPEGKWLATAGQSGLHLWDGATGRRLRNIGPGPLECPAFSPDGRTLAARGGKLLNEISLWETATGRPLRRWTADKGPIACLVFTDGGKTLVTAGRPMCLVPGPDDQVMRFWDVSTGAERPRAALGHTNPQTLLLSPDGQLLVGIGYGAAGPDRGAHAWDAASGREVWQATVTPKENLPGRSDWLTALAFAPDGKALYVAGVDGTLIAFDPATGKELRRLGRDIPNPQALAFAPDGKTVAVNYATQIRLLDAVSGESRSPEVGHPMGPNWGAMTPDGRTVVTADAYWMIWWDAATGRELRRAGGGEGPIVATRMTGDGRSLVTSEFDKTFRSRRLRVWDVPTGTERRRIALPGKPTGYYSLLALAPDDQTLAVGGVGAGVALIDLRTGRELRAVKAEGPGASGFAFGPDGGTLIVYGFDSVIRLWDVAAGRKVREFSFPNGWGNRPVPVGAAGPPYAAAVSPDGRSIALGTQNRTIAWHELATGEAVRTLDQLPDNVSALAFSPDGRSLAWGGYADGTVRLVELSTGRLRQQFVGHRGQVSWLAFSAAGDRLLTCSADTTALLWDLTGRTHAGAAWGKALTPAELNACWADLAAEDAACAYRAVRRLAASPAEAAPFLAERLPPVRAVDEKQVARLITALDGDDFSGRETAARELERLGEGAAGQLRKALVAQPSAEVARRLRALLGGQERAWRTPTGDRLRTLRAVEALEAAGTTPARQVLRQLAEGTPGAQLTREAKESLGRLAKRPSAKP
jgi:RNA polymerase sigma factor (sigma-70 family)